MTPSPVDPKLRIAVDHLLEVENLASKVRRMILPDPQNPPKGGAVLAELLIHDAIQHLVAARVLLAIEPDEPEGNTHEAS